MTTLYYQDSCEPKGEYSEATCWAMVARYPDTYFYYIGEPETIDLSQFDQDFLKVGGTA